MDIEGNELDVLLDSVETIIKIRPLMIIEISRMNVGSEKLRKQFHSFLQATNYQLPCVEHGQSTRVDVAELSAEAEVDALPATHKMIDNFALLPSDQ